MNKKLKTMLIRIIVSSFIFLSAIFLPIHSNFKLILYLVAYFIVGINVITKAIKNIGHGQIFDENFLMVLATIGAFVTREFPEGVMVMLLYQIGEWFQSFAVNKSRKSISSLMDLRPDFANIKKDGEVITIDPEEIDIGDLIIVKPGEKIPLDGIIVKGDSLIDTSSLTGESIPNDVTVGDEVFSGTINKNGLLEIKVTKKFYDSTVSKILELVENASFRKASTENFITKFARYYTPIIVITALLLAFLPPLFIKDANLMDYIHRACSFLVISCPCALVISIPLGFFSGIGGASKKGILIKGSNYLELLAKAKTIAFDKTGTLTQGVFEVTKINSKNISNEQLLEIAAHAENYSEHPIATSIKKAYGKTIDTTRINDIEEIPGNGIKARIDGKEVYIGNNKLMENLKIIYEKIDLIGTIIHVAVNKQYMGYIMISDKIKDESASTISKLKKSNKISQIVMLTGDNEVVAKDVANKLDINSFHANLLPIDKVNKVENLLKQAPETLVFVGDGINDAPVLMRADIGIAMGALGSDAAIEAADIVIMDDNISKISTAIDISKKTLRIVKQNIVFALSVKLLFLLLGAFGLTNMWEAVFADVGVTFIAILNAMRCAN